MARTDNLNNFLADVATAIRTKRGSSAPIPHGNFDTEILAIPSAKARQQFANFPIINQGSSVASSNSNRLYFSGTMTFNFTMPAEFIGIVANGIYYDFETPATNIPLIFLVNTSNTATAALSLTAGNAQILAGRILRFNITGSTIKNIGFATGGYATGTPILNALIISNASATLAITNNENLSFTSTGSNSFINQAFTSLSSANIPVTVQNQPMVAASYYYIIGIRGDPGATNRAQLHGLNQSAGNVINI